MQDEIISMTTNSDTDSLSDYHEKYMRIFNGSYINTDPYNGDTDGDGLSDSDEIELVYTADGKSIKNFKVKADPTNPDKDSDVTGEITDKEPLTYNVSGKTLTNVAHISYANLEKYIGMTIEDVLNSGRHIPSELKEDFVEETLSSATIIDANDSNGVNNGWRDSEDTVDMGFASIALRIPVVGQSKEDIVIYGLRGTESIGNLVEDGLTDLILAFGEDSIQSQFAYLEYLEYLCLPISSREDVYITGYSLGGRLTLDVLYRIYKLGGIKPTYSATFNGLGYSTEVFYNLENNITDKYHYKLIDYYIRNDVVGDWFGDSLYFTKPGKQKTLENKSIIYIVFSTNLTVKFDIFFIQYDTNKTYKLYNLSNYIENKINNDLYLQYIFVYFVDDIPVMNYYFNDKLINEDKLHFDIKK